MIPTSGFFLKKRKTSHLGHVEFEKPLRIPKQLSGAQVTMGSGKNLHSKENPGLIKHISLMTRRLLRKVILNVEEGGTPDL